MVSTCTNVDCFQMSSCPGLEMAVLLELAAELGRNVHVGVIAGALLWTSVWFARTGKLVLYG